MPRNKLMDDADILRAALAGLELQRQRLDEQITSLNARMGRKGRGRPAKAVKTRKKRTMSAEARKRIADAQKKRWAKYRKSQES